MANIIIGHTDGHSTTIWVRGGRWERRAWIALKNGRDGALILFAEQRLSSKKDFTWSFTFVGLCPETEYEVIARFALTRWGLGRGREERGRLRTFPRSHGNAPFSFLHGSCNLSTVRIMHTGGLAAAALGLMAAQLSLERLADTGDERRSRWIEIPFRRVISWIYSRCATRLFGCIDRATRFEQDRSLLPNPFKGLRKLVNPEKPVNSEEEKDLPRFMIHAGDQIYYDIPFPNRKPSLAEYRRTYRQTWFEDDELRRLLAECPHYMIWDDHDIVDAFAQDGAMPIDRKVKPPRERLPKEYFEPASQAYEEYVHCRQPGKKGDETFYYEFQYGAVPFFVLDTRNERYIHKGQMISERQMQELKCWLEAHKEKLKFVVSSVAFLAELREPADRDDKWCGESFQAQRKEILAYVYEKGINQLVFLVGDMHCAYHATMRLGRPNERVTLHELAGGPIYQLQFANRRDFYDQCRGSIAFEKKKKKEEKLVHYTTSLRRVHGAASSVLKITASPSDSSSQVDWEIVSTAEKLGREEETQPPAQESSRPLSGRIRF